MKQILLKHIEKYIGRKVQIEGWSYNIRSSGKIIFIQFRDGTGEIQAVVIREAANSSLFAKAQKLTLESSLILKGRVKKEPRSPSGYEMAVDGLEILQISQKYPFGKKEHGVAFLLDNRHLWLRSKKQRAIQLIRNRVIYSIYDFYRRNDFVKIDAPILTPAACEGTTTLFEIDYFGEGSYLSQSGQLYLEAALPAVNRCFDFAPVFRAEKSKTRRHLIEFWMTDAEMAFTNHRQNLKIQEKMLLRILKDVLSDCKDELKILGRKIENLQKVKAPFKRLTYDRTISLLQKLGSDIEYGQDLGNDDETILMQHFEQPLFVEYYPAAIKAFYMKRHPEKNKLALCADLLAPEGYGEIIGGSQREDDYQKLLASIKRHNLPLVDFQWYLDLRRFGSVPHSGFGLGIERLLAWICGLKHVRETIPFPRLLKRMRP